MRSRQPADGFRLTVLIQRRRQLHPGSLAAAHAAAARRSRFRWEVVALHHSGAPKRDQASNVLTVDRRVWQEWMGEQRIAWLANDGVRVSRLVRHIRAQNLPAEAEPLRQELLRAAPPLESALTASAPLAPITAAAGVTAGGVTAAGGVATLTIPLPLNLSVSLGAATPPAGDGRGEELIERSPSHRR